MIVMIMVLVMVMMMNAVCVSADIELYATNYSVAGQYNDV